MISFSTKPYGVTFIGIVSTETVSKRQSNELSHHRNWMRDKKSKHFESSSFKALSVVLAKRVAHELMVSEQKCFHFSTKPYGGTFIGIGSTEIVSPIQIN